MNELILAAYRTLHTANGKEASAFDNRLKTSHTLDDNSSFMCSNAVVPEGIVNSSTLMGGSPTGFQKTC